MTIPRFHHPARLLLLGLAISSSPVSAQSPTGPPALVIANWSYQHTESLAPLITPEADATAIRLALEAQRPPFGVEAHTNLTTTEMRAVVERFIARHKGGKQALIYFSGHGLQIAGENYLAGTDADLDLSERLAALRKAFAPGSSSFVQAEQALKVEAAEARLLPVRELLGIADPSAGADQVKMIFLDSCRTPPASATVASKSALPAKQGGLAPMDGVRESPGLFIGFATVANQEAQQNDEARLDFKPGVQGPADGNIGAFLAASYRAGRTPKDLFAAVPPSLFTEHLSGAMRVGGSLEEVFKSAGLSVMRASKRLVDAGQSSTLQTPAQYGVLYGSFRFGKPEGAGNVSEAEIQRRIDLALKDQMAAARGGDATGKPPVAPVAPVAPVLRSTVLDEGEIGRGIQFNLPGGEKLIARYCPGGSFTMGSPKGSQWRPDDEAQVAVSLSSHFWMAETECTQGQFAALMGGNPSRFKGDDLPVESVSWEEAQAFVAKLNAQIELPDGWEWRLPSEAQWERACRAGSTTTFSFGNARAELAKYGNFNPDARTISETDRITEPNGGINNRLAAAGSYPANAYGLHDMHGNVWEWCLDRWDGRTKLAGGTDPLSTEGGLRAFRGGSWLNNDDNCRSSNRANAGSTVRQASIGFRVAAVRSR